MIFKAFVKIFVPCYRLWTTKSYERIPWQKTKYVWTGKFLSRGCLKGGVHVHAWNSISPTVKPNKRYDRLFGLKLVGYVGKCWIFRTADEMLVVIPTALTNWTVIKCSLCLSLHFMQRNDVMHLAD